MKKVILLKYIYLGDITTEEVTLQIALYCYGILFYILDGLKKKKIGLTLQAYALVISPIPCLVLERFMLVREA